MTPRIPRKRTYLPSPMPLSVPPTLNLPLLPPVVASLKIVSATENEDFCFLYGEYPLSSVAKFKTKSSSVKITIADAPTANTFDLGLTLKETRQTVMIQDFNFKSKIITMFVKYINEDGVIKIILKKKIAVSTWLKPSLFMITSHRFNRFSLRQVHIAKKRQSPEGSTRDLRNFPWLLVVRTPI